MTKKNNFDGKPIENNPIKFKRIRRSTMNTKSNLLSKRNIRFAAGFILVASIAGIYFLFRPFPAGPSLEVKAKVPEAASIAGWSAYANPPAIVNESEYQRHFAPTNIGSVVAAQEPGSEYQKHFAPTNIGSAVAAQESGSEYQRYFATGNAGSAASAQESISEYQRHFAPDNSD
jgi:hypothetical protein